MALASNDGFPPMWRYNLEQRGIKWYIQCFDPLSFEPVREYHTSYTRHFEKFIENFESKHCLSLEELMYEYTKIHFSVS
jgi:hypothetical protein